MNSNMTPMSKFVLQRARGVLTVPTTTWKEIAQESGGLKEAFIPYGVAMIVLPALTTVVLGMRSPLVSFTSGIYLLLGGFFGTLIIAGIMRLLAPIFGAKKSYALSCRIIIYSATPLAAASLLGFLPGIGILLGLLSIPWTLILLYKGIGEVLVLRGARQLFFLISLFVVYAGMAAVPASMMMKLRAGGRHMPSLAVQNSRSEGLSEDSLTEQPHSAKINAMLDQAVKDAIDNKEINPEAAIQYRKQLSSELTPEQIRVLEAGPAATK